VFYVDHNTRKTSWVDPRTMNLGTAMSAAAAAKPSVQHQPSPSSGGGGMSDEELARMLQEEEDDYDDADVATHASSQVAFRSVLRFNDAAVLKVFSFVCFCSPVHGSVSARREQHRRRGGEWGGRC
jgi:hypothetical protein